MVYKPLESFALVKSETYQGLVYVNLMKQQLVAQRYGGWMHLSVTGDHIDGIKRIDLIIQPPKKLLVSRELIEYTSVGDLRINIMDDFGVEGALIWATNKNGRLLTFPIAEQYKADIFDVIFA